MGVGMATKRLGVWAPAVGSITSSVLYLLFFTASPQGRFPAFAIGAAAGLLVVFLPRLASWVWHRNWRPRRQFGLGTLLILVAACAVATAARKHFLPGWQQDQFVSLVVALGGSVNLGSRSGSLLIVDLVDAPISDDDLARLSRMPAAARLQALYIENTHVTDEGLANLKGFRRLRQLSLCRCFLSERALAHLHDMQTLTYVSLLDNPAITENAIDELKAALPGAMVRSSFDFDYSSNLMVDPSVDPNVEGTE
jgi:hypothetical protein